MRQHKYDDGAEERRRGLFNNNKNGCHWRRTVCCFQSVDSEEEIRQKKKWLHLKLLLRRKMSLRYFRQDLVAQCCITRFVTVIGCRPIVQLCQEAFWSAHVGDALRGSRLTAMFQIYFHSSPPCFASIDEQRRVKPTFWLTRDWQNDLEPS